MGIGGWLAGKIIGGVVSWFVAVVAGALDNLWGLLSKSVLRSPDVTKLPQVQSFASTSLAVVNSAYVLAFLTVAIMVMGRGTIQTRYGPGELIPRLIIGLIGANFAIPLCSTVIGVANALTQTLTADPITSPGTLGYLKKTTDGAFNSDQMGNNPKAFLLVILALVVAVLVGMLLLQFIIRLGLLIVLAGISPIALALHGTPQTEGAAKLWWRSLLGTLGTVLIQAVALHTALKVFLDPSTNFASLGLPEDPGATLNLLIVICMLLGILKVPGLMRRYITKSSPGLTNQIVRVVLIQQLTRAIFPGSRRAAAAGGGNRPAPARPAARAWPTNP